MTLLLLSLMAYQVTGEVLHEWTGIGMAPVSFARKMHLAMSHWSFVLMGMHLGLHIPVMMAQMKIEGKARTAAAALFCCFAGTGLFLFLRNGWTDYMFFRAAFAFLDYEKAGMLVFFENLLMLLFWAFIGDQTVALCRKTPLAKAK